MKHKHAELIKAWADGAEIEVKHPANGSWFDAKPPCWDTDYEYRIKPEPRQQWQQVLIEKMRFAKRNCSCVCWASNEKGKEMNKRLKELAEQAGFKKQEHFYDTWECSNTNIEMLADYIRYEETKACAKHYLEIMRDAVEQARKDERDKCAKLLDDFSNTRMVPAKDTWRYGVMMAANCVRNKK